MIARPVWCRRFIGRRDELALLSASRRALAQSRGSLVLIGGEAGIGKTRLVAQFLREVQGGKASRVVLAECVPGGDQPLSPVRTFLRGLLAGADLAAAPPPALRALAQAVPEALPAGGPAPHAAAPLGTSELFAGLAAAFRHLTAKRAAIAVVEDVHWADRSTLEFIAYLAARMTGMRLLLIATYRPDELEANDALAGATSRLLRERAVQLAVLEPLGDAEVMQLLDGALEERAPPDRRTLREIAGRCDGNPFFAEELLKDAVETQRGSGTGALPGSIRAGIRDRLARLPGTERRILEVAAVLGQRFDPAILARVADRAPGEIVSALRHARDANIVVEERGETRFRFRHALTRQTIYDGVLALDARALHRAVVHVYESLPDASRLIDELAYHAWQAQDVAAALAYNERAGTAAAALGALPEAATCFERALSLARDDDERARIEGCSANVAAAQSDFTRAVASYETALSVRLRQGDYDDAARLFVAAQGERSNMGEEVADVVLSFIGTYAARLSATARNALHVFAARLVSADQDFGAVRLLLEPVSPPDELPPRVRANYYLCFLNLHAYRGDVAAWRRIAEQTHALAAELPPALRATVLVTIAQTGIWIGGGELVGRSLDGADAVAADYGLDGVGTFAHAVRAHHAYASGDLAAATELVNAVLRRPEVAVAVVVAAMAGPFVARARGEPDLAERCRAAGAVRRTLAEERASIDRALLVAARAAGAPPHEAASEMAALVDELRLLPHDVPLHPAMFVLAAERAERRDLAAVVALALPQRLHDDDVAGHATSALVRAIVARREGRAAEAAELAARAAASYGTLGWPLFEARAWETAGERERAAALYRRCGAVADARRAAGDEPAVPRAPAVRRSPLSAREREIAALIADGSTNTAIAEQLGVSRKTVEKHVTSILAKLEVRSRAQIAAHVARGG